jgi:hypothetical protein
LSEKLHTRKHYGKPSDFYENAEITIDDGIFKGHTVPTKPTFRIAVGNILVVRSEESVSRK